MVFSSPIFIFLFLPMTLIAYFSFKSISARNCILLICSLIFYAWGEGRFFIVMLISIGINYWFGIKMSSLASRTANRKWLGLAISINLGILIYFKYWNFLTSNLSHLLTHFGLHGMTPRDVHLPAGVSFFTFHALSYLIDVYRGHFKAQKNPINLGLYIALFPQLIAGPIVRYEQIGPSIESRQSSLDGFSYGLQRFIIGLSKKTLLADAFSGPVDKIFAIQAHDLSTPLAWIGILFYSFQIYFDFSGYSDMAIGMAKMFGFTFPENFNYPYVADSITNFWRRWHISLSSWFRDYLYIPLGGNRAKAFRQYINLFTVFLLCGLWHGASWSFVIWGLFHGILLVVDKLFLLDIFVKTPKFLRHAYVILMVLISWVFFRADTLAYAVKFIGTMFGVKAGLGEAIPLAYLLSPHIIFVILVSFIAATPLIRNLRLNSFGNPDSYSTAHSQQPLALSVLTSFLLFLMFFLSIGAIADNTFNPFIYYRF